MMLYWAILVNRYSFAASKMHPSGSSTPFDGTQSVSPTLIRLKSTILGSQGSLSPFVLLLKCEKYDVLRFEYKVDLPFLPYLFYFLFIYININMLCSPSPTYLYLFSSHYLFQNSIIKYVY